MTQRDKWKKRPCVLRFFAFRDEVKRSGMIVNNYDGIVFHVQMPKSWSNKKKIEMDGEPHIVKPDVDNLLKSLLDSVFEDDSHIHSLSLLQKRWSFEGKIDIS